MRQGLRRWRFGLAFLAMGAVAMGGCAPRKEARLPLSPEQRGEELFTKETFGGNGRVCSTCHELDQFGTITPAFVQQLFKKDPAGPLFRPLDSDDGVGTSYKRLLEHATVRIPIKLPTRTASGLGIRKCDDPANTSVVVNRGNPSVFNMALEMHIMHDGREGDSLETQAVNAVRTHNRPGRDPTPEEAAAIAAFQESLFSHEGVKEFLRKSTALKLPEGTTPPEKRGRAFFEPKRQCGVCHSGPMLNRTSKDHDFVVGDAFESSRVGMEPGNPNEKFRWCYVNLETNEIVPGPTGSREVYKQPVSDPGRGLVAGVNEVRMSPDGAVLFVPNETAAAFSGPIFKIPTLWGTPDTAPYFHDNSAKDLEAVLAQYNFLFRSIPKLAAHVGCDAKAAECLSESDRADIISFMQLLSFERGTSSRGRQ
jgi:cytochrome c peroxidase